MRGAKAFGRRWCGGNGWGPRREYSRGKAIKIIARNEILK